ncbi:MAG: phosphoenolpyruvate carboxylase [Haloarculaceae archaeon]
MELHARELTQDVRELGDLLGAVLAEQTSLSALETVESIRTASIAYRRGDADSRAPMLAALDELDPAEQNVVARAFTTYFELVNLAEERQRVRELREESQDGMLADSVAAVVSRLADADADPETVERLLGDVLIEPTFTAHPTEARRKTIKAKLRAVAEDLETLDEVRLTDRERRVVERDLEAAVVSLWQTPQVRRRRPAVTDEALNVQWYLENVLFEVVPAVYDELERQFDEQFDASVAVPTLFEFRSWAGSDRDGNPHVTADVTEATLRRQRATVLPLYRDALKELSGALSQDRDQLALDGAFAERLAADRERLPGVAADAADRYPDEPYRQKLKLMRERVLRVDDVRDGGYDHAAELLTDLRTVADSLRDNDAAAIAEHHVDPLIRRVDTFGFTLASLDVRDHRKQHTAAVAAALAREDIDYAAMDEGERVAVLTEAVLQDRPVIDVTDTEGLAETPARVLGRFDALADWQREFGADAVDTYAVSMTEEPSHVLEVLFLADQAGIVDLPEYSGLDVVPLLETEYALSGARRIMGTLFENEAYAQAVAARGDVQEVMLGYSDSNKENGFLAANWSLLRNQKRLARICDDHDVALRLFHGRGGSISRGGGPMNDALLALPRETVSGQVKFTEQGEAIAEKYADPAIAERNLEQMLNAQVRARWEALADDADPLPEEWVAAMDTAAAAAARAEYRDLLETEGFVRYFEQATPITVIEDLNLGSRPASRSDERSVADLRAIPWVFSWTQSRCILPGWYSLATGLDAYLEDGAAPGAAGQSSGADGEPPDGGDLDTLRTMYREWDFFRTTIDNAAVALARTDVEIARAYARLADDELRERFFPRLREEYERAVDLVTTITHRDSLLTREWLEETMARRNPYVDPLNFLQIRLLDTDDRSERERRTLRLTVQGIAAGMQNTG